MLSNIVEFKGRKRRNWHIFQVDEDIDEEVRLRRPIELNIYDMTCIVLGDSIFFEDEDEKLLSSIPYEVSEMKTSEERDLWIITRPKQVF